ncbi:sigma-54-dependent Fis family transcriptional regulator [Vibrio sp. SCSIO 43135]|uniref:sigma-54-dependent Fis family transcriptional regulator n=1 Tax=Vibrio sp. SCSIO 43135 TaxID=2819096 RepID=UPI00207577E7|nr:sigma-54-dependent Fis family transcriptional regulator [Vibrio sp. SCSIO 43135]USD43824.1 sigma-54-dependent Fis family transcriptional regulator [Vibrio sp. SCSIO 43135]
MQLQVNDTPSWLSSSWVRSSDAGLKQRKLPEDTRISEPLLKQRKQQARTLIEVVERFALPLFNQMFARTDSRLILTDNEGVVIASWGQERFQEKLTSIALGTGSCWLERLKGTNAIGTALVEAKPISVIGEQHFIKQHQFISCSASPVLDHMGNLRGVLDITSEQQQHDVTTQVLVQNMVQLVENHLLSHIPEGSIRVDLACEKALLNSGWQGIVIADQSGLVVAHNQVASQLLSLNSAIGSSLDAILEETKYSSSLVFEKQYLDSKVAVRKTVSASSDLHYGDSTIEHAWQQANKVIDKDVSVLILGETGVGKGEFVKALHKNSAKKNAPLVTVNCGALPKDLVESELFGHVPGAFTGASSKGYIGKVRQADKGILFLDEIADMPLEAQCRLLHVLQEKVVVPVGSTQSHQVDIQVIAATHKNLEQLVERGEFRLDLYYRLNGLVLNLPALRNRADKQALYQAIHAKYAEVGQKLSVSLIEAFDQHTWPGNLRELDNVLKVSSLLASDEAELALHHLPSSLLNKTLGVPIAQGSGQLVDAFEKTDLKSTIDSTLLQTFEATQGNVSKTSRLLGVSRNTIYRKLKAMGIISN